VLKDCLGRSEEGKGMEEVERRKDRRREGRLIERRF
jgi:hypothetical protein